MKKDSRIQFRCEEDDKTFLKNYAKKHNLALSKIFRDFINWLRKRDEQSK